MTKSSLMALSAVDGRYKTKTTQLNDCFNEYILIKQRITIEIKWLLHLSQCHEIIPLRCLQDNYKKLHAIINHFDINEALQVKKLEEKTNHDVKAVEYYLQTKFKALHINESIINFIHFGCTSEDINNLAYALMLKDSYKVLNNTINSILLKLKQLTNEHANIAMLSRTHGQPASPTTLGKEFANVYIRLSQAKKNQENITFLGKMNGAVGNYNAHQSAYPKINWLHITQTFVESLGLTFNCYTTQIEPHDYIAQLCYANVQINTILLDFSRDIWSYISLNYFTQKINTHETGSSTMPHKVNPIDFENCEGNLGVSNALLLHYATKLPISRWQRDLTDSTVLRSMGTALGHSLIAYQALRHGLNKLAINHEIIKNDLSHHWEVLAEPIQTIMRKYGISNPYEQLKTLTRGEIIDVNNINTLIEKLKLTNAAKQEIKQLKPENYLGLASELAKKIKEM